MTSQLWRTFLLVAGLVLTTVFFFGCTSLDSEASDPTFSVTFHSTAFRWQPTYWVVVHDVSAENVLAVRTISGAGTVHFPYLGDRISVTIGEYDNAMSSFARTYLNVAAGAWQWGTDAARVEGQAEVALSYPATTSRACVRTATAGGQYDRYCMPEDSQGMTMVCGLNLYAPETGGSLLAFLDRADTVYYGWLSDKPVNATDTVHYSLTLDHVAEWRTITSNRTLNLLSISFLRGGASVPYPEWSYYPSHGASQIEIAQCADFPHDAIWTDGYGYSDGDYWDYAGRSDDVPSTINFPEMTVTAVYDTAARAFSDISTTGTVDVITANWFGNNCRSESWTVSAKPGTVMLRRPVLPDSVLQAMGFAFLIPGTVEATDWDTAPDYEGYIRLSNQSTASEYARYGSAVTMSHYVGGYYPIERMPKRHDPLR